VGKYMKYQLMMCALSLLGGCASHGTRVSCTGNLQPINVPAPAVKAAPASASSAPLTQSAAKNRSP